MLQKPSVETLGQLASENLFLMDIGIWLLSDKALDLLMKRSAPTRESNGYPAKYDLYSEFGLTLGEHPVIEDAELNQLTVAILPLPGGEFHHFGTSPEIISSTLAIQNAVIDQREIMHHDAKPHPSMFVQNADIRIRLTAENTNLWIENSFVGERWSIESNNIITGVPRNDWHIALKKGECVDIAPIGEKEYAVRPYGFTEPHTPELLERCGYKDCPNPQTEARMYPVLSDIDEMGHVLNWMLEGNDEAGAALWKTAKKLSADEISAYANLSRLTEQRAAFRAQNWEALARNYEKSVFYQVNLDDAAREFAQFGLKLPEPLPKAAPALTRISDTMFRARWASLTEQPSANTYEDEAFRIMREGLTETAQQSQQPHLSVYADQIVWSRCPVRIDLAGGWTDTPPYSLKEGGNVVNIAIELNGQPPLQVYIKPAKEHTITLRSIDLGASEVVRTYEELADVNHVGSPFSIPKAALVLAGFHPRFSQEKYATLEQQLQAFGSGIEMTMLTGVRVGHRDDDALGHPRRFGIRHIEHPGQHRTGCHQRVLRPPLGPLRDIEPHPDSGTVVDHRRRLARPIRRRDAGRQTAPDATRLASATLGALVARHDVHRARVPETAPALLYRHHPYRQRHLGRNRARHVPQLDKASGTVGTDETACIGPLRRHPTRRFLGDRQVDWQDLDAEPSPR